ncbi:myosin heavy chain, embryonic smooth muscle isoform [Solenopsis invicta]|uniref:myosin heavy chain, embryonic smooth muscle isoform n=1 Tax=Solenopsis invicta TaxID=13686 RepID=UPI00193DE574|nr:myosin heavy chain, embryonic smooth muscle isoform [Solenopsis invicta]
MNKRHCAVCKKSGTKELFAFPSDPDQKLRWKTILGFENKIITLSSYVCILHFQENYIDRTGSYPKLKDNAVPYNEDEKPIADERISFELERAYSQLNKQQAATEKMQEEFARMQLEMIENMYEKHEEVKEAQSKAEWFYTEHQKSQEQHELEMEWLSNHLKKVQEELYSARKAEQKKCESEFSYRLLQEIDKLRNLLEGREAELKRMQSNYVEAQLQLEQARDETGKVTAQQECNRSEIERARIEAEKMSDERKVIKHVDRMDADETGDSALERELKNISPQPDNFANCIKKDDDLQAINKQSTAQTSFTQKKKKTKLGNFLMKLNEYSIPFAASSVNDPVLSAIGYALNSVPEEKHLECMVELLQVITSKYIQH